MVGRSSNRALTETRLWVNNLAAGSMTEKEPLSHLKEGMQRVQIVRERIKIKIIRLMDYRVSLGYLAIYSYV